MALEIHMKATSLSWDKTQIQIYYHLVKYSAKLRSAKLRDNLLVEPDIS